WHHTALLFRCKRKMTRPRPGLVVMVLASAAVAASAAGVGQAPAIGPARQVIVLVGSSIFHRWTGLTAQMAPLPILNRAFDGAQTSDMLATFDTFVLPVRPKVVVYYCGSNDVDQGEPATAIAGRIREFAERVEKMTPHTRFVFVSIIRAPE